MSSIYDARIKCLETLAQIQKDMADLDEQYIKISSIEGKPHTAAWNSLASLTKQYRDLYKMCKPIIQK